MTSIILSTICALALNAAPISAPADTNDLYVIDDIKVEHFDGSQLAGKQIGSYKIILQNTSGTPTRIHYIVTGKVHEGRAKVSVVENSDSPLSGSPLVIPRGKDHAENILLFIDGKQKDTKDIKQIKQIRSNPNAIASIVVMKDSSAEKYVRGLKDQGKLDKNVDASGGIILITTKKGLTKSK